MNKPICVLHLGGKTSKTVKLFDDKTWEKVQTVNKARHEKLSNSKYFEINLPNVFNDSIGYHSKCYRNFTSISMPLCSGKSKISDGKSHLLRSDNNETPCTSSTGVLPKVCLFCDHNIRRNGTGKREPLGDCQTLDSVNAIKNAAKILKDDRILSKIAGIDMIAKEAKYHHSCKRLFIRRADKLGVQSSTCLTENNRPHNEAFTTLQKHIEHTIISLSGAELLTSLHSHYLNLLQIEDSGYSAKSLCDKILKEYPTSLSTTKENNKSGIVIYHNSISEESAIRKANFDEHAVKETASYLRSVILNEQSFELPHPLNADALGKGQA